ncbi:hypothetical protein VTK73DRAFT_6799 [Phialemonium thermophilum]|uniref:Uncharacterized protein n=1 Tax=Phialemonium thermophilum TaxID=223376 RepID=A0ABR3Y838_9PEZI
MLDKDQNCGGWLLIPWFLSSNPRQMLHNEGKRTGRNFYLSLVKGTTASSPPPSTLILPGAFSCMPPFPDCA